jgi:N-acetylmuramoyl-L-alanine amidase
MGMSAEEPEDEEEKKKNTIAIDPGHGDHHNSNSKVDPGAVNGDDYEKDIALVISNLISEILREAGIDVIQTRDGDVLNAGERFQWRIDKADGADIFISIHNDGNTKPGPNGFTVYYKRGHADSKALAESIQSANTLFRDRGTEEGNFRVLNLFKGTAVLVEAGFISNPRDLQILKTQSNEVASQIAKGIINYLKK